MKAQLVLAAVLVICSGCGETKAAQARMGVVNISKAAASYQASNGRWPETLESLTEQQAGGGKAFLSASALVDPWGRPYHYDANDRHPDTQQPLIWSEGPSPGTAASKIANWTLKE